MGFADRRVRQREERETFGRGGSARRYRMRQKMILVGDVYWIEDEKGEWVFRVDGKARPLRTSFRLEDAHGRHLCTIQNRATHLHDTIEIEGPEGGRMAVVHKALVSPPHERWTADIEYGPDLAMHGKIADHEYEIEADGRKIARVTQRSLRRRDTYGVEMAPDQNCALLLAVTVAIDEMAH